MKSAIRFLILLVGLLALRQTANAKTLSPSDWPIFLHRSDMVWKGLPNRWDNAPFLGNGDFGTIFWVTKSNDFRFEVSRSDLYDHRRPGNDYSVLHTECRLPNGQILLGFGQSKLTGDMRLDLWNAELRANISSGDTKWKMRCFTHAKMDVIVLELTAVSSNSFPPVFTWHPDIAITTRAFKPPLVPLTPYPAQQRSMIDGINVSVQSMPEDARYRTDGQGVGEYANAWTMVELGKGHLVYYFSTKISYPGTNATQQAVAAVLKAKKLGLNQLVESHRTWWHQYYPKSFLSIPDSALESFYWIQMYKMGSASRQGGPLIDLQGPWYMPGGWPAAWWNLNMQLTYWPFYMANHLEEAEPLADVLWKNRAALAQNAAPYETDSFAICRATGPSCLGAVGKEVGNLPWTMHDLWLYYRSSMDDTFLREKLFPLMKGSFNYINHIAITHPDGQISLPATASPEYSDNAVDCSYTMACFRWLASAIIQANDRLKTHDPIVEQCHKVLDNLVSYEVDDKTGILVGNGIEMNVSHRHWSHLFMIYPFHEWDWNDAKRRPLMEKSLDNWTSRTQGFAGYSWLGAASMYEAAGDGDKALKFLHIFLKKSPLPNTLYREGPPVIETPLACARTLQEMLMTSFGSTINIFPGIPSTWRDISFADLRAQGAFLVSASRRNGATQFISIKSLAGEPLRVRTGLSGAVLAKGGRKFTVKDFGNGLVGVDLKKGETVVLYTGSAPTNTDIEPVNHSGDFEPWGQKRGF